MFNILIQSKAQMKSFNIIGWNDYAQPKQNNPPKPGTCFPTICFPSVFTKCHSFALMGGQPLPSKLLGIQLNHAFKHLKSNQTSLMGLTICFLPRWRGTDRHIARLWRRRGAEDAQGSVPISLRSQRLWDPRWVPRPWDTPSVLLHEKPANPSKQFFNLRQIKNKILVGLIVCNLLYIPPLALWRTVLRNGVFHTPMLIFQFPA